MQISALLPKHYAEAADLWVATWREEMPTLDFAARRTWLFGHLAELAIDGAELLGAFDGRLLGFITINAERCHIDQLAVSVDAKGQGVALTLLDAARSRSPHRLELDVNEHNPRARRFYEKHGFSEIGRFISERSGPAAD